MFWSLRNFLSFFFMVTYRRISSTYTRMTKRMRMSTPIAPPTMTKSIEFWVGLGWAPVFPPFSPAWLSAGPVVIISEYILVLSRGVYGCKKYEKACWRNTMATNFVFVRFWGQRTDKTNSRIAGKCSCGNFRDLCTYFNLQGKFNAI